MVTSSGRPDRRVGVIGVGAIGAALIKSLVSTDIAASPVAVLVRPGTAGALRSGVPANIAVLDDLEAFLAADPDIVVECAGHHALAQYGPACLTAGCDLIVASVGALSNEALLSKLQAAARDGGRLSIPAGALGGLDVLNAARRAGLDSVAYTGRKRPLAWTGTPAEDTLDLERVTEPAPFFQGTAREAARDFPKNANVVAAVALAGIGLDETTVTLSADPTVDGNCHRIEAIGTFGRISAEVVAHTLPENPKTSMLAPYSLLRAVANLSDRLVI